MQRITVVPLSTPLTVTKEAWDRIASAERLFLQSELHPCAAPVLRAGIPYTSMDDLYEGAEDFDELGRAVAKRLLEAGDCTFAVTGAFDALLPLIRETAGNAAEITVLPGVPLSLAAFPEETEAHRYTANSLPENLLPEQSLLIEEVDSAFHAGELKLSLMEYYPDEWPVQVANMKPDGRYERKELPLSELDRERDYDAATVLFVPGVPFGRRERYGFEDVRTLMRILRGPGGCPWDREQTHESIRQNLVEECYEVLDAIDREDDDALIEELGDVLLQVMFHSTIAEEQFRFTDRDVCTELVKKMILRHPHVFGDVKVGSTAEELKNWASMKIAEKGQQSRTEVLQAVPTCFPALLRSRKVQKRAADAGFDWGSPERAFEKVREETGELDRALKENGNIAEELGDLLFAVSNVARLCKLEPEFLLAGATEKFIARFGRMERTAEEEGLSFENLSDDEKLALWNRAKDVSGEKIGE